MSAVQKLLYNTQLIIVIFTIRAESDVVKYTGRGGGCNEMKKETKKKKKLATSETVWLEKCVRRFVRNMNKSWSI